MSQRARRSAYRAWVKVGNRTGGRPLLGAMRRVLHDQGLARAALTRSIVDRNGEPLPWYTYPAIEFLDGLDFSGRRVFEFGAGNSTQWWRRRADEVISVESDAEWFETISKRPWEGRGEIRLAHDPDEFTFAGRDDGTFDVVVVDGVIRRQPTDAALEMIGDDAMIILDNSDWLPHLHQRLRDTGMIAIDFHGLVPAVYHSGTTTVFLTRDADFWSSAPPPTPIGGAPAPQSFTNHDEGRT